MKKWYKSKTILSAIVAVILCGYSIYKTPSPEMIGALSAALVAIYGRFTAKKLIR